MKEEKDNFDLQEYIKKLITGTVRCESCGHPTSGDRFCSTACKRSGND